jgi:hypothetical protein
MSGDNDINRNPDTVVAVTKTTCKRMCTSGDVGSPVDASRKGELAEHLKIQETDRVIAEYLQQDEDYISNKASPTKELQDMGTSSYGRAIIVVQEIIAFVNKAKTKHPLLAQYNVDAVAQDDMVFLARQMLDLQDGFKKKSLPSSIDVGYHHTNQSNMKDIRKNGLLTKADREIKNVRSSTIHGSVFGDGIYSSDNPTAFKKYGDVGLLVGRLEGKTGKNVVAWRRSLDCFKFTHLITSLLLQCSSCDADSSVQSVDGCKHNHR